jgi:hypothetical protein
MKNEISSSSAMTYGDFYKKNISLKKIKLPVLQQIAKNYQLKHRGNKQVLIERIEDLFQKHQMANHIQKVFRGYMVRLFYKKREPASICVNETDFYTMEPLSEISRPYLYIYLEGKIAYGFHLESFVTLIRQSSSLSEIKNPYNRTMIPISTIRKVCSLFHISNILFPKKCEPSSSYANRNIMNMRRSRRRTLSNDFYPTPLMELYQERVQKLTEIREKRIEERVRILFTELDRLGNYTTTAWFHEIRTLNNYLRLYRSLFNIWYHHSQMPLEVRQKICMCGDPFENVVAFTQAVSTENVQENCLRVLENMIFMGIDDDHCKLGALHALSALTVVSLGARETMPWLYEQLMI